MRGWLIISDRSVCGWPTLTTTPIGEGRKGAFKCFNNSKLTVEMLLNALVSNWRTLYSTLELLGRRLKHFAHH